MAKFITFEGGEGVGKSTQLGLLKEYIAKTGQKAVFTREPGGTPLAEKIRGLILREKMSAECEAGLFAAARADHIDNFILPKLAKGYTVICDRYIDSSIAYQGYGRKLGEKRVLDVNFYAVEKCMPDAVVFFDMNPLKSWRRQEGIVVENDRMEAEKDAFHAEVYRGYKILAAKNPAYICVVPENDVKTTAEKIVRALRERGMLG
jgi:dTMP kinase